MRSARTAQTPRRRGAEPPKRGAEPTRRAELSRRVELPSGAAADDEPPSRVEPPSRAAEPAAEPSRAESLNTCAAPPSAHSHRAHRTTWRMKASKDTVSCCALADCPPPASSGGRPTASAAGFVNQRSVRQDHDHGAVLPRARIGRNKSNLCCDEHTRTPTYYHDTTSCPTSNTHRFARSSLFGALQLAKLPTGAARFWLSQERTPEETVRGLHGRACDGNDFLWYR